MRPFGYRVFSARKVSSSRGGGIATNSEALLKDETSYSVYEGFFTYGVFLCAKSRRWQLG
ncbi:MAG: hypothetical protein ACLUKN_11980 [Bacilli bacterium]